jgi:hypothetical protein
MGNYLAHGPVTSAQPSGEFWPANPCRGRGAGMVTMRLGCARQHGGEVTDGKSEFQMSGGLHQREEGRAGVAPVKFMVAVAHRDDGAVWGSRVDSARRCLISGKGGGDRR